ncbi:hypothetical protein AMTR_s00167p00018930 [Amborella trichopoda]|uniref:Uncharacterized protein n=1 Tax=Amborella trichopoda TaxID=13333 RepID=W1PUA0_AMBTC|nr:hypothetical protein AMTR_s00167p00018930 [Amborella trichopoda]
MDIGIQYGLFFFQGCDLCRVQFVFFLETSLFGMEDDILFFITPHETLVLGQSLLSRSLTSLDGWLLEFFFELLSTCLIPALFCPPCSIPHPVGSLLAFVGRTGLVGGGVVTEFIA